MAKFSLWCGERLWESFPQISLKNPQGYRARQIWQRTLFAPHKFGRDKGAQIMFSTITAGFPQQTASYPQVEREKEG